jgi:hypothetical protein
MPSPRRLLLPFLLLFAPWDWAQAAARDVGAVRQAFLQAVARGSVDDKRTALQRLVDLADPALVADLQSEFGRVSIGLRRTREQLVSSRARLDRQESLLAGMQLRLQRDPSLEESVRRQERRLGELRKQLEKLEAELQDLDPWYLVLGEESERFFGRLGPARRKKAETDLWKEAEEAPDHAQRLAATELLGFCGAEGTAIELQKRIVRYCAERARLERELPKMMGALRKLEQRWQKEQDQMGGSHTRAMQEQYERARKDAARAQADITMLGFLADSCAEAGARSLAREQGAVFEKSLSKLMQAQAKARDGARSRTLRLIGLVLLLPEKEAGARVAVLCVLTDAGDQELSTLLLESLLTDKDWIVRSRAARSLAMLRVREAVPVLIERLPAESGRMRTDLRTALVSLTGKDFRDNVELWRRWWQEHGASFEVPPLTELARRALEEAKEAVGATFFGIETESRKVLFVLDLSGSMNFSMVPRNSPSDEDPRNPDMPRDGESSRLDEAKRALLRALGGISEGARFNLLLYATDVWSWQDKPVVMDAKTRAEAMRYVEALEANGGTNIYGALMAALDMAGATGGDEWRDPEIDTIYFLSDGRPSVGVTTDPDAILAFVRGRNSSAGITIHSIGLSGAQDAYLMRSLAEENSGTYVAR